MRYSKHGLIGITLNDKALALLAHSLHSCIQLVRNLTSVHNVLSNDRTHHLEESNARIQADNSDIRKLRERQYQYIDRLNPSGHHATVFIIVSGTLTVVYVNVKNALQIGKACMEAYKTNYLRVSIIK